MRADTLDALATFRKETAIHGYRMGVLRRYADVVVHSASIEGYVLAKQCAERSRGRWWASQDKRECFACGVRPAVQAHHVIQLQHGGADIDENKVGICYECHADIHPWIPI